MDAVSGGKNMRGKMLFVSIALLVMLFFVETASAQVNVATLEQLQAALAGNDKDIIVTKTIVIDEDLMLNGGGKTVKLDSNARIQLINSATFEHITIDGGELQRSNPLVVVDGNGGVTLTLGDHTECPDERKWRRYRTVQRQTSDEWRQDFELHGSKRRRHISRQLLGRSNG